MTELEEKNNMIHEFLHTTRLQWELKTAQRHYQFWNGVMWDRIEKPCEHIPVEAQQRLVFLACKRKDQARDNCMYLTNQIAEESNQHE